MRVPNQIESNARVTARLLAVCVCVWVLYEYFEECWNSGVSVSPCSRAVRAHVDVVSTQPTAHATVHIVFPLPRSHTRSLAFSVFGLMSEVVPAYLLRLGYLIQVSRSRLMRYWCYPRDVFANAYIAQHVKEWWCSKWITCLQSTNVFNTALLYLSGSPLWGGGLGQMRCICSHAYKWL